LVYLDLCLSSRQSRHRDRLPPALIQTAMRSSCIPSLPVSFKKHGERGRTPEGKYTLLHAYAKYFFVSNASKHHATRRNFFCGSEVIEPDPPLRI
jgi:hypothetical protein